MSKVRVFLVEDELIHAENAKISIEEAGFEFCGEIDQADKALEAINEANPDIVLMDISLPGKNNGITLATKLKERNGPPVIFATSFSDSETIKEAAETSPSSYLVKPISTENLKAAVTLALSKYEIKTSKPETKEESIFIKSGNKLQKVFISDILWIEAAGDNYCKVVTADHQLVSRHTIKAMIRELNSDQFIQTHRAYVVNKHKIESIHEKEQVVIIAENELPIGRSYKDALYETFKKL